MVQQEIMNPMKRSTKIDKLERNTPYRLYIWAQTVKGVGESYFIEGRTLDENRKYYCKCIWHKNAPL